MDSVPLTLNETKKRYNIVLVPHFLSYNVTKHRLRSKLAIPWLGWRGRGGRRGEVKIEKNGFSEKTFTKDKQLKNDPNGIYELPLRQGLISF